MQLAIRKDFFARVVITTYSLIFTFFFITPKVAYSSECIDAIEKVQAEYKKLESELIKAEKEKPGIKDKDKMQQGSFGQKVANLELRINKHYKENKIIEESKCQPVPPNTKGEKNIAKIIRMEEEQKKLNSLDFHAIQDKLEGIKKLQIRVLALDRD
jgi:hypothetical protein